MNIIEMDIILENKLFQKSKISRMFVFKRYASKLLFLIEKKNQKDLDDSSHNNCTLFKSSK